MTDYDNSNRGILFKNDKKGEGSKQPDYNGKGEVFGKDVEIAGWVRTSGEGKKFLSLKFQEPRQKKNDERPAQRNDEEDIPF